MIKQVHTQACRNGDSRYATREDFLKIFDEDLHGLYQLSFLLTGDHEKGERCFVAGIEDCAEENRVFMEWARGWAKRVVVKNAIRDVNPQPSHFTSSALPTVFSRYPQPSGPIEHSHGDAVLRLADFERFVFVLCVLEHYREYECALLLGCSPSEVREARIRAMEALAKSRLDGPFRYEDRDGGRWLEALKA
jgi:hypothetical protein